MSRFKSPSHIPASGSSVPNFDESKVAGFLGMAQVKAQEMPRSPAPPARLEPVMKAGKIVIPDARSKSEIQSDQFVLRFTKRERLALDEAFEKSGYRYLQQYVRSLVLPHLKVDEGDPEGE